MSNSTTNGTTSILAIVLGLLLGCAATGCGHSQVASALGSDAWGPAGQSEPPIHLAEPREPEPSGDFFDDESDDILP